MSDHDLTDAIECMKWTPEKLTTAQLALLMKTDHELGLRALRSQQAAKGITSKEAQMADVVATTIQMAVDPLRDRLKTVESRVLELEADKAAKETARRGY